MRLPKDALLVASYLKVTVHLTKSQLTLFNDWLSNGLAVLNGMEVLLPRTMNRRWVMTPCSIRKVEIARRHYKRTNGIELGNMSDLYRPEIICSGLTYPYRGCWGYVTKLWCADRVAKCPVKPSARRRW